MVMGVADARGPTIENHSRALPAPKDNPWNAENAEKGSSADTSYYGDS